MSGRPGLLRTTLTTALACAAIASAGVLLAGEVLARPALHEVGAPPGALGASAFAATMADGHRVVGWQVRGEPGAGVVLLLHGVRADRRSMLDRALWLHHRGHGVVLVDLPGHGESAAEHLTYGEQESRGVDAVLDEVARTFPGERIGVVGVSLGAASFVLSAHAAASPPAVSAVVLESMFPTIDDAVRDRLALHLGDWAPRPLAPLLLWQLPWRAGVEPSALRPLDALPSMHAPLLIAAGSADRHTPLAETRRLFDAAAAPKQLWVVEGAAHVDLHRFAPAPYESRVGAFLDTNLHRPTHG